MPLDERVRLRIKLQAQKLLRSKQDSLDTVIADLHRDIKKSSGERREAFELLLEFIETSLDNREINFNDQ